MGKIEQAALLRIFTDAKARHGGRPLYEAVVLAARDAGLAGAAVLRGAMGYGASKRLVSANILDLSSNLPLVIEIVDTEASLRAFLPTIEHMSEFGLATIENVEVIRYGKADVSE